VTKPGGHEFIKLNNENLSMADQYIWDNAQWPFPTLPQNAYKGQQLIICGAGPSLEQAHNRIKQHHGHVWACNSALNYLTEHGLKVTHGCAIEQTERMYTEVWTDPPDVAYFLASSCHPGLVTHLMKAGIRRVAFFHNFTGVPGEYELYQNCYEPTIVTGEGLNVTNRMLGVALHLGYSKIWLAGVDCAISEDGAFHAGGATQDDRVYMDGTPEFSAAIGTPDRHWRSTPDMLMSAIDFAKKQQKYPSRVKIIGDVLPKRLRNKNDEFLDRIVKWANAEEHQRLMAGVLEVDTENS